MMGHEDGIAHFGMLHILENKKNSLNWKVGDIGMV